MNNILFVGEHPTTYEVQWHTHDHWELVYCTGGEGTFTFENGGAIHYGAGDTVAIPPKVRHSNASEGGFTNIHIRMDNPSFPYHTAFRVEDDLEGNLRVAFSQAKYYYLADINKRELVLAALGELISSYLIVFRDNSSYSDPLDQIRKVLIRSYDKMDFALDEAIRAMPFNYDYLRKLFKKEMGVTPLEYMTRLRMKKAETMLTAMWTREYSMAEIAGLCGYGNPLYFSRVFKKYFGCSPTAFANRGPESGGR